tara:strand:- start:33 stop:218 length:186 start_codon:yes stop_codon:yes gene_type:complete
MTAIDWKNLPWTNELGNATHIIKRTGVKVMIYETHEDGLIHALCGNEASVWVNINELEEVK